MRSRVAIMGIGSTAISRDNERSVASYALEAAINAVADAGLTLDDIDGLLGCPGAPNASAVHGDGADEISARSLAGQLGLRNLSWLSDLGGMAIDMAVSGRQSILAGDCAYVLGVRAHYFLADRTYSAARSGAVHGDAQFTLPFGYGPAGTRFATRMQRYFTQYALTREDLYPVIQLSRENARLNEHAFWRLAPVPTLEDYLTARPISEPLGLLDCDLPVCGASAFVMSSGPRAKDGPHDPAYLAGVANWTMDDDVFERSGISRSDVAVAQIYDGYSIFVPWMLESLGWCEPGTALARLASPHEQLPAINTFGGALGEGRLHGIGHLREGVLQVSGRAGPRQVDSADNALVQIGSPDRSWQLMLSREEGS
ncbi:thiolase family protein [Nocardioides sp.]|uniref:thiolase family protein n=1 Tax=Nocardioides sp. TaxID=35761 RepID=UPI003D1212D1